MLECRGPSVSGFYVHLPLQTQRPQWCVILPLASNQMVAQQSIHPVCYLLSACRQQQLQDALHIAVVYMRMNVNC